MKPNRRIRNYGSPSLGWRQCRDGRRRDVRKTRRRSKPRTSRRTSRWFGLAGVFLVVLYGVWTSPLDSAVFVPSNRMEPGDPIGAWRERVEPAPAGPTRLIDKSDVQALLEADFFVNLDEPDFDFEFDGRRFRVETTLDPGLQRDLRFALRPETARYLGAVAMDADTGRVLAMVSHDSVDPGHNTCIDSLFPAASVFKIVTAAAAIEEGAFGSESVLSYAGGKYTLYKRQVHDAPGSGAHRVTLRDSFAQSINPVFGRLGVHDIGKSGLARHGEAFGFNRPIPFEIPVGSSPLHLSDDPYQWAEVASGFNRTTLLSPLHGAMIVAAIATGEGRLPEPAIVARIRDENGRILYRASERPAALGTALSAPAAREMRRMMAETVRTGTGRRGFQGFQDDPVLSRLEIGGKTGTIGSRIHAGRLYDWFVGYAAEKEDDAAVPRHSPRRIAVSVAVAHDGVVGVRSQEYARLAIESYFQTLFAREASAPSG